MRVYTVSFEDVAITVASDLFQIEAVTIDAILLAMYISQSSDVGDAEAEGLLIRFRRVTDVLTNVTAEGKTDSRDAAALADLNVNDTTPLVTGAQTLHPEVWHINQNFIWLPPPELQINVPVDDVVTVNMAAPADSLTVSGVLYFGEGA